MSSDQSTTDKVVKDDKNKAAKTWIFRHSNYTSADEKFFKDLEKTYMCYGKEIGEQGTPHLQGTITFTRAYRLPQLVKMSKDTHWEVSKTTDSQNYCMKDKDYIIQDNRKQGCRSDLTQAIEIAREGGIKAVAKNCPAEYVKFRQGLESLIQLEQKERNFKPKVIWIYGSTGLGKTKTIHDVFGYSSNDIWISPKNLNTWFAYENQPVTVLDEFRDDVCPFHELLKILDRYPLIVKVNYGHRIFNSRFIFITSPFHPTKIYDTHEQDDQLLRRIDKIFNLKVGDKETLREYKNYLIRHKFLYEIHNNKRFKNFYVKSNDVLNKRIFIKDYYKEHNLFVSTFKTEFKKLRLMSSGVFNFFLYS